MSILITGIAGGLAQIVAERLFAQGQEVVGVDYRPIPPLPGTLAHIKTYKASYCKTAIEDVFRQHAFESVLHLGRVGNLTEALDRRFEMNVVGSQKIMSLCVQYGVRKLVVLSTFHIYGAQPNNHIPIAEEEPLRAGGEFPQLSDAIQLDNMASTWIWKYRDVSTVVLRPTNVVGPTIRNTMSSFLRLRRVPYLLGFNPMTQFIHEEDLSAAVLAAEKQGRAGIYNLAGEGVVPWRTALELARAETFPLPSGLVSLYLKTFSAFPAYLVNFFKYPCVISTKAFRDEFDWAPRVSLPETIWSTVERQRLTGHDVAALQ